MLTTLRYQDVIMATEFQNVIFASAARINAEFCLIVKRDGTVVYADPGFLKRFSTGSHGGHGLDVLLESGGLSDEDKKRLLSSVENNIPEKMLFSMLGENLSVIVEPLQVNTDLLPPDRVVKLAVNPLSRPPGYSIVRAVSNHNLMTSSVNEHYFTSLEAGLYSLSGDGTFKYVNDACSKLLGIHPDELQHQRPEKLLLKDSSSKVLAKICQKDGSYLQVIHHILPLSDKYGSLNDYYIIVPLASPVISGSADGAAIGSPSGVWDFLEHSPIANILLDDQGRILKANPSFYNMAGCESKDVEGTNFLDLMDEHSKAALQEFIKAGADETSQSNTSPLDIQFAGEKGLTVLLYISRIVYQDKGAQLICYLIDTTEQKNLELRFVHSQKMQAIGQLAGGIAHDFNNLLTAMIGFCDLLLMRHPAGDQSFADIMQIKQNANRAANLVRQLLAFSRKQTLQPEVLDITGVLEELSSLIGRLIGENIQLDMQHGRDLKLVKVDQGQLEQVIINLAVNARDAMLDNGSLTIKTSNVTVSIQHPISSQLIPPAEDEVIGDGEYVLIEVVDTGHGIPKELIGKIFEPFFSTKEIGSGTGLGLSTVYGIVKQTGGYIYVTSKKNQGSTFSIFLKSYHNNEINTNVVKEVEHTEKVPAVDLTGSGTVLLVEDESPVRIFSAHALANKGYSVLEAESGDAALEIIKEKGNTIDVIVTDVIMPGMNGPAMIEQITKQYPNIKVIFMSGYAEDAFIKSYGTERKFNFLPKPFTLKQLAGKVKEVLRQEEIRN